MINLNKRRIDFGKGDVGIGVIGNTTDSAQLAFYNQSARPIHIPVSYTHLFQGDGLVKLSRGKITILDSKRLETLQRS